MEDRNEDQDFISKLATFRNPMDWDAIVIEFGGEGKLNKILIELVDRGLLLRERKSNKFDLHPLVRKYCYDRLRYKEEILMIALELFNNKAQDISVTWAFSSIRALFMFNAKEALKHAIKARGLANAEKHEQNIILVEWLLGAAHLLNENLPEADTHLIEALIRDRKINLVEYEPNTLLELAKLRFKTEPQARGDIKTRKRSPSNRCEYRLKQADIHNFLAEFYLDAGDLAKARQHGESAKERAGGGYMPAMEKAEKLSRKPLSGQFNV